MPAKPMLDDIELQLVQDIEAEDEEALAQHGVPVLEGDFLQDLGRRASRVSLTGVMVGEEVADALKKLRDKFRTAEPVPFVADIATATKVDKVLIEEMGLRDLTGKPERFEYSFLLREFIPPPPTKREEPPPPPPPRPPPPVDVGTLIVEVIVEGDPNFDFSTVTLTVEGTQDDGTALSRTLTNRQNNIWTEEDFPPGRYTAEALVTDPQPMSGSAQAAVRAGQISQAQITLRAGSVVATTFLVHFRFDNAFLEPCMREVMRQVAEHAANNTDEKLLIVGHTDKTGSNQYNQSLSERRARSVYAYLTFGRDRTEALNEWNALRARRQPPNQLPAVADNWDVREYQHILQDLRFYPGAVDGQDGPLTQDAVRAYRCHKGLPAGTTVDDEVWNELIQDYLGQDAFAIPETQFFPNCDGEILKWLGCGEEDPVNNTSAAHRPNRRTELLFVRADRLPCQVPQPDTFDLPAPGAVNSNWCLGPGSASNHCCVVSPHLQRGTNTPQPCPNNPQGPLCRQPAESGTSTVEGSIQRERPDGTLEPVPNQAFVLIAPNGQFKAGEQSNGEPTPARTRGGTGADRGTFSFPDMPVGFYSLEVRTPASAPALVRLRDGTDADIKGNAVCKALRAPGDRLDVVIVNAPVLREIRLPVAAHLMTALHPVTREIRTCPAAIGPPTQQATTITDAELRAAFDEANRTWRQARIRFELEDANIVREAYAFRTECEVDESEFTILLQRCAYPDAVNVFFVGDLAGLGEAGFGVSPEGGAALGVAGCAVGDRFQTTILGPPLSLGLDAEQRAQVLAHELGHFLNLDHADDTPANANRLMLPGTFSATNRTLIRDEVNRTRASRGATDDCVPLSLEVTGATRIGGSLGHQFIFVQHPILIDPFDVTIDAKIPDPLLTRGTLTMTGGNPGANSLQRTVSKSTTGEFEIVATYTLSSGGNPVNARVVVKVATLTLQVEGATQVAGSSTFVVVRDPNPSTVVTIIAQINPAPFCVPTNLVTWTDGNATPDPLRRTVSKNTIGRTTVSATVAGETRSVTITVIEVAITSNNDPFGPALAQVQVEGVLNEDLSSLDRGDLFSSQPDSLFRLRAGIPGVTGNTIQVSLISNPPAGAAIETLPATLTRQVGDSFISLPILAIPSAIQRGEITPRTLKDLEVIRTRAGGTIRFEVPGNFAGLGVAQARVRGRVIHIFSQAFQGSGVTAADIRRHIRRASRAWAQAGIEVKERQVNASVPAPPGLLELDQNVPFNGVLTAEERRLLGVVQPGNPARSTFATDVNIYYLEALARALATAYESEHHPEITDPNNSGIAITLSDALSAVENDTTLSHEMGHLLLVSWGAGEHQELSGSDWPAGNVMHTPASDAIDLHQTQVENILLSVGSGTNPFIIFEP
ncbi:MAG: OmpA family protein [Chromatiales bacterium]